MEQVSTPIQSAPLSESAILHALRDCYHPELSLSLIDLGTVEEIALTPDPSAPGAGIPGVPQRYRLCIALVPPPTANDATNSQIVAIVRNRFAAFEQLCATEVILLQSPAWAPGRMTSEARARATSAISNAKHGLVQIR